MSGRRTALAARRAAMGHTQESLADLLRIERSTVTRWERVSHDDGAWARARGWALRKALLTMTECIETDPEQPAVNHRMIGEVLADHDRFG
jgi:transcriptional regulator with XRE-family HTH domain